jgi:2'-5' RNA ligase
MDNENKYQAPVRDASAIVTNLAAPYDAIIEALWDEFRLDCEVEMKLAAHPVAHLSWQGAESYDLPLLYQALAEIAREIAPFTAQLAGVGLFTYPVQVVYLTVVKDEQLMQLHRQIWEKATTFGTNLNRFYAPSIWMPHITLAYKPYGPEALKCILHKLAFRQFDWQIRIDHLGLLHSGGTSLLIKGEQFTLEGGV